MKRIITLALVGVMSMSFLAGCGKFTCDMCEEEKSGKKHKEELLGEEIVICDDCYEGLQSLGDLF